MVTSRWSALHNNGGLGGWEHYFSTMFIWQHLYIVLHFTRHTLGRGGGRRMFCPTWGWLCRWQDLWVWPSDTDHLMSSPLYICHSPTWSDHLLTYLHPEVYVLLNDPLWVCYLCKFDWFKQTLRNFHLVSKFQSKYWQTEKAKKKWSFSVLVEINDFDVFIYHVKNDDS